MMISSRSFRQVAPRMVALTASVAMLLTLPRFAQARQSAPQALPLCKTLNTPKDALSGQTSNLAVVEQGYRCLLRHYVSGARLDDRVLLRGAFAEMQLVAGRAGAGITLGTLTGNRNADWAAFARTYTAFSAQLAGAPSAQRDLALLSLDGMAGSLHDDHTGFLPAQWMKDELAQLDDSAPAPTIGLILSPTSATTTTLYVTGVMPHTPAATAGGRPGDSIVAIDNQPPLNAGQLSAAAVPLVFPQLGQRISLTLERPATGVTLSITLSPRALLPPATEARVVAGDIAYVRLYSFTRTAYDELTRSVASMKQHTTLHGLILDLRGNLGGDAGQAVKIVSALVHHKVIGYEVTGQGTRTADRTDDKVRLLHLPLAVLTDGDSASSSELVAGAVRDYHLGSLVGQRTSGALAGANYYGLSDGSGFEITVEHVLGPLGEKVDGIGIPPAQTLAATAADLSAGHDPVIDQAVRDLRHAATGQ